MRAVLWDLDGTLVDSEEYHWRAWQEIMRDEGVAITRSQFEATFGQRNDTILAQWLGPEVASERRRAIAEAKEAAYRRFIQSGGLAPLPGATEWVKRLSQEGWPQAIASSAPRPNVAVVLAALARTDYFQAVVSAEDVPRGKPDPQVFLAAASRLGVRPPRCIVVEDAAAGIEAARRAGMRSIGISRASRPLGADVTVGSLADLPLDTFDCLLWT